jgi:hypothetical protein
MPPRASPGSEPGAKRVGTRLGHFDRLVSSNLLEAELRSALTREGVSADPGRLLEGISWVHPDRPLTAEFERIAVAGYVKGADLWHLACALFIDSDADRRSFMTLRRPENTLHRGTAAIAAFSSSSMDSSY